MDDRSEDLAVLLDILRDAGARGVLIGGVAVGYHGHERATVDVDFLVRGRSLRRVAAEARARGYDVRTFLPDEVKVYPRGSDKSIADVVAMDVNPVLRAAFREVEQAEVLGEQDVSVVRRGALVALKFHSAVSPTRLIEDKYQDISDLAHLVRAGLSRTDEETAHRIAALSYPGAAADFDEVLADLRAGRSVKI